MNRPLNIQVEMITNELVPETLRRNVYLLSLDLDDFFEEEMCMLSLVRWDIAGKLQFSKESIQESLASDWTSSRMAPRPSPPSIF